MSAVANLSCLPAYDMGTCMTTTSHVRQSLLRRGQLQFASGVKLRLNAGLLRPVYHRRCVYQTQAFHQIAPPVAASEGKQQQPFNKKSSHQVQGVHHTLLLQADLSLCHHARLENGGCLMSTCLHKTTLERMTTAQAKTSAVRWQQRFAARC